MKRVLFLSFLALWGTWVLATDYVAITEVMYDTPLNENTSLFPHCVGEFIELYNAHEKPADLTGWSLQTDKQCFTFPAGTSLSSRSFLVVAYGTVDPYEILTEDQILNGWTDFHLFYNLDPNAYQVILQTDLMLHNAVKPLVLKDSQGVVRDSLTYHALQQDGTFYAGNATYTSTVNASTSLCDVFSIQRKGIYFNLDGTTPIGSRPWEGSYYTKQTGDMDCNSVGKPTRYFFTDLFPTISNAGNNENYVQEITPRVAMANVDSNQTQGNSYDAIVRRTYYDAMFHPVLEVLCDNSPARNNIFTLTEYDIYGRKCKEWLPIAVDIDFLTTRGFKQLAPQFYNNESKPFNELQYTTEYWENGILKNELIASCKAGIDMRNHKVKFVSRANDSCEVKLFGVTHDGLLEYKGCYIDSMLRVSETIDEDNITKVVYTNLSDQVVMEKVDNAATYYVYNELNQLCYVLPPLANTQIDVGVYGEESDVLNKYAYVYKYDERGNQIYKRLPGCEPVLMVYDKGDKLVLSQTGSQRAKGNFWMVYKYDALRRLVYTAEIDIREDTYEEYLQSFSGWYMRENFSTGTINHPMSNTGYSRSFFHNHPTKLLTVNYYDNYDFLSLMSNSKQESMTFSSFENNDTCCAKGLLTGTRTYYLDASGDYTETVYYYDYRGREIQRRSTNHLGGYDVLSTKYDFTNNVTDTWLSQSTNNGLTTTEHYHYTYDHANRPLTTTYTFNNESPIVLQSYHYDELGRVRSRHIHNGIDSVAFCYDIRNQITQIKSSNYEQTYYYNKTCPIGSSTVEPTYNGNISATTWTYENQVNGYMYYYDKLNRLKSTYSIINGEWGDYYYSENFTYDAHGNIATFNRWDDYDVIDNLYLTYNGNQLMRAEDTWETFNYEAKEYHNNNTSSDDFAYDANGNMIYDKDRGISAIRYNLLNLPDTIQFANGNQIVHRYDAAGNRLTTNYYTRKVATVVPLGNALKGTFNTNNYHITREAFHNNCVYTANNRDLFGIEFVHNPEGYIRYYGSDEHYHFYYIKDLLGNIRETYVHPEAGYKECVQRMQYYPSGLPWEVVYNPSEQPWKYNGKEFVEMHGLDEYDSKARWYYPAICRTTTIDPLAEKYYSTSPYAWCGNNPVRFVDPNGMEIHIMGENDSVTVYDVNTSYDGSDNFTTNIYDELNTLDAMLSNTDFMSYLVNSSNVYKISLTNSTTDGTHSYIGQTINIGTDHEIDYLGHELFHAYQDAKGQGGASIYNEVEAYLFQAKILFMNNYGRGSTPLTGEEKSHSPIFSSIINALIYEGYSQSNFNQAIELFKTESNANASGIYNNYPLIRNNQTKSLIKSFYPIYP